VDDWVAEQMENEANRMPPSYKQQADILRRQARIYRESSSTETVEFLQEIPAEFQGKVNRDAPAR
jgi:hypothetical protein